jgi:hypothetical protein
LTARTGAGYTALVSRAPIGLFLASAAALLPGGCARTAAGTTPEATIARFTDEIRAGRFEAAYSAMSSAYRRRVPFEEFRRHLEQNPAEARELASTLSALEGEAIVTAEVPYGDGDQIHLVLDGSRWRISGNVVDFYDQSTPRSALRSFVRAMDRERYDVVLRFVPEADREGMTVERMREAWSGEGREEIERLLANLRASLDNPIEEVGDRATMPYGERFTVQFVREGGVWKIEDPD